MVGASTGGRTQDSWRGSAQHTEWVTLIQMTWHTESHSDNLTPMFTDAVAAAYHSIISMRLPEIHRYGQVFNFVADNIHCWADAEGAQVWEVQAYSGYLPIPCRVLAFSESDAQGIVDSYFTEEEDELSDLDDDEE